MCFFFFFTKNYFHVFRMKVYLLLAVLCYGLTAVWSEEESESARLLVSKKIMNKYLVENMDIIVKVKHKKSMIFIEIKVCLF